MNKFFYLPVVALLAISITSCGPKSAAELTQTNDSLQVASNVKVVPLKLQTIKRTEKVTAAMVAQEETYLAPALSGKIRSIKVDVNDRVKKGDILVQMDQSQLLQTRVQYQNLKKDLARMDTLLQYGSVTQQAYDQMKTQVSVTGMMLNNLEENTELRAPYAGVITGRYFSDGELFSPAPNTPAGKSAIVSLIKMDVLKVNINLSERYLPLVKVGQVAQVETDVYPGKIFEAKVFRVYPVINAATRTFTIELHLNNPDYELRPGMYSTVTLEMGDRSTLLIPAMAVLKQPGTNTRYIFIHDNGIAKKVIVQVGERLDDMLELTSNGIQEGDEVIYAGHVNLMDGERVEVISN